jgi:hypothetical protein
MVLNGIHTSEEALLAAKDDGGRRLRTLGISPARESHGVRNGRVLVAGMSAKAAWVFGLEPEEWERWACAAVRDAGMTPVYRPKPSWTGSSRIEDYEVSGPEEPIQDALKTVQAVVTHHSNVGVDCLVHGVPYWTSLGVAKRLSAPTIQDLKSWRTPRFEDRVRLLSQIAWQQFSSEELRTGFAFRHLLRGVVSL